MATGHLYNVLTGCPAGRTRVAGEFARDRQDDHGSGRSPATTAARATTIGDERLVRDVVRCLTVLRVLKTTACAGNDGDLQSSERRAGDYDLGAAAESAALRLGIGPLGEKGRESADSFATRRCPDSLRDFRPGVSVCRSRWPRSRAPSNPTKRFVSSSPALLTSVAFLATL